MSELYNSALAAMMFGGSGGDSYSKAETDALLGGKADLVDGTIPAAEIPPEVFERMKVVADDTARFALTTADVQNGDIVYVDATQVMYYVYDDTLMFLAISSVNLLVPPPAPYVTLINAGFNFAISSVALFTLS